MVSFSACKKQVTKTTVSGTVVDYCQGTPIADAYVYLELWQGTSSKVWGYVDGVQTGADGKFEFEFRAVKKDDEGYLIRVVKDGYYEIGGLFGLYPIDPLITKKEDNQLTYGIVPEASVEVNAINQNPFDDNDEICVTTLVIDQNLPYSCRTGQFVNEGIESMSVAAGNCYNLLEYSVTKNNITTNYIDSIFCEPFLTTVHTIYY